MVTAAAAGVVVAGAVGARGCWGAERAVIVARALGGGAIVVAWGGHGTGVVAVVGLGLGAGLASAAAGIVRGSGTTLGEGLVLCCSGLAGVLLWLGDFKVWLG